MVYSVGVGEPVSSPSHVEDAVSGRWGGETCLCTMVVFVVSVAVSVVAQKKEAP